MFNIASDRFSTCLCSGLRPAGIRVVIVCCVFLLAVLAGCGKRPVPEGFHQVSDRTADSIASEIDIRKQGLSSWMELASGIDRSLAYVSRKNPDETALDRYDLTVTWGELRASLLLLRNLLPQLDENPELLAEYFRFVQLGPGPKFTGYYEPAIEASLEPSSEYLYPIYAKPDDMQSLNLGDFHPRWEGERLYYRIEDGKVLPYHDRSAIDGDGVLQDKGLEVAWARDPVDIFFLQIQGSGRLILEDGSEMHVLYAGKNGHQYVSLGRVMREMGLLDPDNISMQSIRDWLNQNPHRMRELLDTNPSYVFFRLSDSGPYGSIAQPLTARVSLATDPRYLPLGGVLAFTVPLPEKDAMGNFMEGTPFTGLGLAQDTGGAIKKHRIDFFSGYGEEATWVAGHLNAQGSAYLLLPKQ